MISDRFPIVELPHATREALRPCSITSVSSRSLRTSPVAIARSRSPRGRPSGRLWKRGSRAGAVRCSSRKVQTFRSGYLPSPSLAESSRRGRPSNRLLERSPRAGAVRCPSRNVQTFRSGHLPSPPLAQSCRRGRPSGRLWNAALAPARAMSLAKRADVSLQTSPVAIARSRSTRGRPSGRP